MKRTTKATLAILGIASTLASCNRTSQDSPIAFESYSDSQSYILEGSGESFDQDGDVVVFDSVSIVLPTSLAGADITALRDSITSFAFGVSDRRPIAQVINQWKNDNIANVKQETGFNVRKIDDSSAFDVAQGYRIVSGFLVNMTSDMIVYCVKTSTFEPSDAHSLTTRRYINYLFAENGKVLTLNDIFTSEGLKQLPARIAEQAEAIEDEIGPTSVTDLPSDNNFFISSEDEIVFCYQPYEIAPFSQSSINIAFYPHELADYMTPVGISIFNLEDISE